MSTKSKGRPFPKGVSGNPAGRPVKSDTLSDCLREVAGQPAGGGLTHAQKLARVCWRRAEAGDMRAAALIRDSMEGRPAQRVELTGPEQELKELRLTVRQTERPVNLTGLDAEPQTGGPER